MADHSDKRTWADQQPTPDGFIALWLTFAGSYVSGAGPTAEAAWASAKDAEVLSVLADDSGWPPDRVAFDAKVAARAADHRLLRVEVSAADVVAFCDAFGITDERVLRLIAAAVTTESDPRD